ncbi:unnamed protein product [Caenorhabditis sp. 36 PRJEB53466]|nr:unnamed protein product [Caenorhabditis sp. 36 PRJEB53466]
MTTDAKGPSGSAGHLRIMPRSDSAQRDAFHYFSLFLVIITWLCVFQAVILTAPKFLKLDKKELPDLSFAGDFIVYAYGRDRSVVSSSFAVLNAAASSDQRSTSQILHHFSPSEDEDIKSLDIQFQMSTQNLSIDTVIYAFVLRMRLDYHSIVDTEILLSDTLHLHSPTSQIQTTARLCVDQSVPFGKRETFRIIDRRRQDVEHFQMHSVLRRVTLSPLALELKRKSSVFLAAPSPPPTLSLRISLSFSEMEFIYKTGFWELLKWFWIQYFAAFIIVNHLFTSLTSYLFRNRVFYVNDVIRSK